MFWLAIGSKYKDTRSVSSYCVVSFLPLNLPSCHVLRVICASALMEPPWNASTGQKAVIQGGVLTEIFKKRGRFWRVEQGEWQFYMPGGLTLQVTSPLGPPASPPSLPESRLMTASISITSPCERCQRAGRGEHMPSNSFLFTPYSICLFLPVLLPLSLSSDQCSFHLTVFSLFSSLFSQQIITQ